MGKYVGCAIFLLVLFEILPCCSIFHHDGLSWSKYWLISVLATLNDQYLFYLFGIILNLYHIFFYIELYNTTYLIGIFALLRE